MKDMKIIPRPKVDEYSPSAKGYIDLVPQDGKILEHLAASVKTVKALVLTLPPKKLTYRWAEGEWTVKEILVHIMDTERILAYRALRFARNDATELIPYDHAKFVSFSGANERKTEEILKEFASIRRATLTLFNSLDEMVLTRAGMVNGKRVNVRGLVYMVLGHELHHLTSIRENYGIPENF